MIRFIRGGAVVLLVSALVAPVTSRAEESLQDVLPPLQVGPVLVHPSLAIKETYNDNVYYTAENTKSDFITSVFPDVTLKLPFRMHELTFGAGAEMRRYAKYTELDATPYQIFGLGDFSIGDRVKLKVGDTYVRGEETPLESPSGTSDMYTDNQLALSVKYAFVDVAQAQLDYTRTTLNYLDSTYRSRAEDLVSVFLYYRALPNTSAFLEYDFKNVGYDESGAKDNVVHTGFVGATWEITEYSKGTAKAGFLSKNFSDASLDDYSTWTASIDLQHHFSDAASMRLLGKRDVNEGKYDDTYYYTTTGVFADFTYLFLERLSGVIEGSYSADEYSNARNAEGVVREDKTAHVGIGAKYSFNSWLDFVLGFGLSNRNSNIANFDAAYNTVSLKVTAYR